MGPGVKKIFESAYFELWVNEARRLLICVRTEAPFASLMELHGAFSALIRVMDTYERSKYLLLCDMRRAIGRNDPEFEQAMTSIRPRWLGGFRRVAVRVKTTLGSMQIRRYSRDDGIERLISSDEQEIEKYLMGAP